MLKNTRTTTRFQTKTNKLFLPVNGRDWLYSKSCSFLEVDYFVMEEDSKNMYSEEDNDLMSSFCVEISKEEHQFLQS